MTIISRRLMNRVSKERPYNNNASSNSTATIIRSLPKELLTDVIANVASHSLTDLHYTKLCCKDFLEATQESHVFQKVSLNKFPFIQWHSISEKELSFLKRCRESQNLESLYREGLRECLGNNNISGGLEKLNVAAQKGHKEANYVYGMILLCSRDQELREQGLEHVRDLRRCNCVVRTRKNVQQLVQDMWLDDRRLVLKVNNNDQKALCGFNGTCKGWRVKNGGWVLLDDDDDDGDDIDSCEFCRWDHELKFFYWLFNVR